MTHREFCVWLDQYGLGHILEGGIFYGIMWLIFDPIIALTFVLTFYFSRERRDYEIKIGIGLDAWYRGWEVWRWDLWDLVPVSVFYGMVTVWLEMGSLTHLFR